MGANLPEGGTHRVPKHVGENVRLCVYIPVHVSLVL